MILTRCSERNVYKWRSRWERSPSVNALYDAERSGRPASISMQTRCRVVQLACARPTPELAPFRLVWTQQALADALLATTGKSVSRSAVQRLLSAQGLRPHEVRAWLHSPDERFAEKVERICDLYVHPAPDDTVVLCLDAKPMQVLGRRFPCTVAPDGSVRQDYEYVRRGVRHLLGALNIKTGRVHGRVVLKRDADALLSFVGELGRIYRGKKVRKHGPLVILESGPEYDPYTHARLRRVSSQWWTLEMPTHSGRWEETPFRAPRRVVLAMLVDSIGWTLQPMDYP